MDEGGSHDSHAAAGAADFLRLDDYGSTVLVEVDADGFAVREVLLTSDGRPRRAADGPEVTDYVYDYAIPALRPGTSEFDLHFAGRWTRITAQEFDAAYRQAELHPLGFRELPRHDQRRQLGGCFLITLVGFVSLAVAAAAIAIVLQLRARAARTLVGLRF